MKKPSMSEAKRTVMEAGEGAKRSGADRPETVGAPAPPLPAASMVAGGGGGGLGGRSSFDSFSPAERNEAVGGKDSAAAAKAKEKRSASALAMSTSTSAPRKTATAAVALKVPEMVASLGPRRGPGYDEITFGRGVPIDDRGGGGGGGGGGRVSGDSRPAIGDGPLTPGALAVAGIGVVELFPSPDVPSSRGEDGVASRREGYGDEGNGRDGVVLRLSAVLVNDEGNARRGSVATSRAEEAGGDDEFLEDDALVIEGVAIPTSGNNGGITKRDGGRINFLQRRWKAAAVFVGLVALAAIGGAAAGMTLMKRGREGRATPEDDLPQHGATEEPTPTVSPSVAEENVTSRFVEMREFLSIAMYGVGMDYGDKYSVGSVTSLHDPLSPQYAALSWLADADGMALLQTPANVYWENGGLYGDAVDAIVQRYALAVLYYATGGDGSWKNESALFVTDEHECLWFGVSCYGGTEIVGNVTLVENGLRGTLPSEVGALNSLTDLDLSHNDITGELPASLGKMSSLRRLSLEDNGFSGPIPDVVLGNLANLTALNLGANKLTGSIPRTVFDLGELYFLSLYSNHLTSVIPTELSSATKLEWFSVWSNSLSGVVPDDLGALSKLSVILLGENVDVGGSVPASLGRVSTLSLLGMWDMNLTGTIPPAVLGLPNLVGVTLGGNRLTGRIPDTVGDPRNLKGIGLEENELTGQVPSSLGKLRALEALGLHSNLLSGTLPSELGNCVKMRGLEVGNNRLNGTIPESYGDFVDLEWLSLAKNDLAGSLGPVCDIPGPIVSSDCEGPDPEVECDCCLFCCNDDQKSGCDFFLSSRFLLQDCFGKGYCDWQ